jgi:hypothetical protein
MSTASEGSRFERRVTLLKDLVSALRDGTLFILFLLLLFTPATMKEKLLAAGFTKGSIAGMEWEGQIRQSAEQTKEVGEAVSKAGDDYKLLIERLTELESRVREPEIKASLVSLGSNARSSQRELAVADKVVKRSLLTQQSIVEAVAPSSVSNRGWLFLGKVNEQKDQWGPSSPTTIAPVEPTLGKGTTLTIRDDTYWRADSQPGQHANAPILSVARVGTHIIVEEVDYSHARGGGWYVWVKARSSG